MCNASVRAFQSASANRTCETWCVTAHTCSGYSVNPLLFSAEVRKIFLFCQNNNNNDCTVCPTDTNRKIRNVQLMMHNNNAHPRYQRYNYIKSYRYHSSLFFFLILNKRCLFTHHRFTISPHCALRMLQAAHKERDELTVCVLLLPLPLQ